MGSQITKIPSICGDSYPGVGFQVDNGDSVRVAMAWPSASADGWRSLTMEVPKKLSLETELNGVSVDYLLQRADVLFGDGDRDGFKRYERALGDKMPSAVVRAFARYAPVDSTHIGTAETCRCEIEQFLGGDIPELDLEAMKVYTAASPTAPSMQLRVWSMKGIIPQSMESRWSLGCRHLSFSAISS